MRVAAAIMLALGLLAGGCWTAPKAKPQPPKGDGLPVARPVKIGDLSTDTDRSDAPEIAPKVDHRIVAEVLLFPYQAPLMKLTTTNTKTLGVPPQVLRLWERNHLHIGAIEDYQLGLFRANLGKPVAPPIRFAMQRPSVYQPIPLAVRAGDFRITDADRVDRVRTLRRGRFQVLVRIAPPADEDDVARLIILPQHHRPTPSVRVQTVQQKTMAGTLFEALRLSVPVRTDRVWVISANLPLVKAEAKRDAKKGFDPQRDLNAGDAKKKKIQPMRLGPAMFSGTKAGARAQVVILLRVTK